VHYVVHVKQFKPQIRLPTDEGPNPYDSKTPIEDLPKPVWMRPGWLFGIIGMAIAIFVARWLSSPGP
jgi:hypothetical protein